MNPVPRIRLRAEPADFTGRDVRELGEVIRRHDLFCKGYDWNREFSNDGGIAQNDFVNHLDGTVTDRTTGLMWQRAHRPAYGRWRDARAHMDVLNAQAYCGYRDWRLPTIEECCSLFTPNRANDGLFIDPLFTNRMWLWTADVKDRTQDLVWNANLLYGSVYWIDSVNGQDIRAVRTATVAPGRELYQQHLALLAAGDPERLAELYRDDAQIVTARGSFAGRDVIRRQLPGAMPVLGDRIVHVELDAFSEADDVLVFRRRLHTRNLGVIASDETMILREGRIFRHVLMGGTNHVG